MQATNVNLNKRLSEFKNSPGSAKLRLWSKRILFHAVVSGVLAALKLPLDTIIVINIAVFVSFNFEFDGPREKGK